MASLLAKLKNKVDEIKQEFSAAPAESNYERQIADHVERATSPMLAGPDWGLNFELVDLVNNDAHGACDKVFRAIRRALLKPNVHTQLLALSLLEACVKNCVPFFFQQLIYSDLWQEILRAGEPTRNWDPEVRDRALGLVEDFARGLPLPAYKDAYEGLLDRGVDFPVRPSAASAEAGAPYYTPPPLAAAAVAAEQGISPEDRAAIAAAVADLEAQAAEQAARDAALAPPGLPSGGHVPALMGPAVLMGAPIRPPGYHPPAGYHPPHPAAEQPAMVAGAQPIHAPPAGSAAAGSAALAVPQGRAEAEQTLRVARNSAELLQEMLDPVKAPGGDRAALQETFVTDLADQCFRYKSVLAELIPRLTEEDLISTALAANDDLSRTLREYEQLLQGAGGTAPAAGTGGSSTGGAAAAAASSAAAGPSSGGAAGGKSSTGGGAAASTFTLGDDEDDELSLQSIRGAQQAPAAVPAGDMLSFDAPAAAGSAAGGEERLVQQMDELLMGGGSAAGSAARQS